MTEKTAIFTCSKNFSGENQNQDPRKNIDGDAFWDLGLLVRFRVSETAIGKLPGIPLGSQMATFGSKDPNVRHRTKEIVTNMWTIYINFSASDPLKTKKLQNTEKIIR